MDGGASDRQCEASLQRREGPPKLSRIQCEGLGFRGLGFELFQSLAWLKCFTGDPSNYTNNTYIEPKVYTCNLQRAIWIPKP